MMSHLTQRPGKTAESVVDSPEHTQDRRRPAESHLIGYRFVNKEDKGANIKFQKWYIRLRPE